MDGWMDGHTVLFMAECIFQQDCAAAAAAVMNLSTGAMQWIQSAARRAAAPAQFLFHILCALHPSSL